LRSFESFTAFQQRILCHRLPTSFDEISRHGINQLQKHRQESQRRLLTVEFDKYETELRGHGHVYELEWTRARLSANRDEDETVLQCMNGYLAQCTNRHMRTIRFQESRLHTKLSRRRSSSATATAPIDVYPCVIVDTDKVLLNRAQLDYLSRHGREGVVVVVVVVVVVLVSQSATVIFFYLGPSYIRPNQSYLHSHEQREKRLTNEHRTMMAIVESHLIRVHRVPLRSPILRRFSQQTQACLRQHYLASLSYLNIHRTRKELNLVQSIRFRLKKSQHVLRVTDKSGVFHIGRVQDYEQKADAYRRKTKAYVELDNDPLWPVFDRVTHLLNELRAKKHIHVWQLDKMMPKREKVTLAHLYFNPKSHKVIPLPRAHSFTLHACLSV
jgi:hypothetical protein